MKPFDFFLLGGKKYQFNSNNFSSIKFSNQSKKLFFIDGGLAELVSSPGFSVHFVRVGCVSFDVDGKQDVIVNEFFVESVVEDLESGECGVSIIPHKGDVISNFSFFKGTFPISSAGNIAMRLGELDLAKKVSKEDNCIVVLDGSLSSGYYSLVDDSLKELRESSNNFICGISKSSSGYVPSGASLDVAFSSLNFSPSWCYRVFGSKTSVFFARLNKYADRGFRIDCFNEESFYDVILPNLAAVSNDLSCPGYPFGLVLVDSVARVSNSERDSLKFSVGSFKSEKALDFHSVLDSMSY